MTKITPKNQNSICLMPWIHMHIWPNGKVFPCCMSDQFEVFDNINTSKNIFETINNDKFKKLRLDMLDGKKPASCNRCYTLESQSHTHTLRRNSLTRWAEHLDLIDQTNLDGSINHFQMKYLDIRFSNLCNFKCRTCGSELSSSWYEDILKLHGSVPHEKFLNLTVEFYKDLEKYLPYIQEVYFAGGESLLHSEHYKMLDYWITNQISDVKLCYTTNFSNLVYKNKDIFSYWRMFKNVHVSASLDAMGTRAEYMRHGTDWKKIEQNRQLLGDLAPNVVFEITPTLSIFNILHFPEFHKDWYTKGWLKIDNIRLNLLTTPACYSIKHLPFKLKNQVEKYYDDYFNWLKSNHANEHYLKEIRDIRDFMFAEQDNVDQRKKLREITEKLDLLRQESFAEIFPELGGIFDNV